MYPGAWVGAWYGDWFGEYDAGDAPTYADMAIQASGSGSMVATQEALQGVRQAGGGIPRRRRKRWMLEVDDETLVFDSLEEREAYIMRLLEQRKPAEKKPVIKRRVKRDLVERSVEPPKPRPMPFNLIPTEQLIAQRLEEEQHKLEAAGAIWRKQLELEDEEILWLL